MSKSADVSSFRMQVCNCLILLLPLFCHLACMVKGAVIGPDVQIVGFWRALKLVFDSLKQGL